MTDVKPISLPPKKELQNEFESGRIPRSKTWQAFINGLYLNAEQFDEITSLNKQFQQLSNENQTINTNVNQKHSQIDGWQQQVLSDKTASANSAQVAATSATNAQTSESAAKASEQASEQAKDKAKKWANLPHSIPVETNKYSSLHYAEESKKYADTITNGMYFSGSWNTADGLPSAPTGSLVPWYRITGNKTTSIGHRAASPGDQLCWDPVNKEWFIIDTTDQVTSVNGQIGVVSLDSDDVGTYSKSDIDAKDTAIQNDLNGYKTANNTGRKNLLINGDFRIWQRGDSFSIVSGISKYTADRFYFYSADAATVSKQTIVPANAGFQHSVLIEKTSNSVTLFRQVIEEGQLIIKGKTSTVSAWIRSKSGNSDITLQVNDKLFVTKTVGTDWVRISGTAIVGDSVIGSNLHSFVDVEATDSFYITGLQLELGNIATEFERTHIGTEMALCQRYYQTVRVRKIMVAIYPPNGDTRMTSIPIKTMRTIPTISPAQFTNNGIGLHESGAKINDPIITFNANVDQTGIHFNAAGAVQGNGILILGVHCDTTFKLNAEFLNVDRR